MGGVRGRPDGRRPDRPHRPPREARPVPRRVLPRPPCPHAGGLAAQKACALPMLRLLNFRCSFCSNPLDETQNTCGRALAADRTVPAAPVAAARPRRQARAGRRQVGRAVDALAAPGLRRRHEPVRRHLGAHRRGRPAQLPGDLPARGPALQHPLDRVPLVPGEPAVGPRGRLRGTLLPLSGPAVLRSPGAGGSGPQGIGFPHSSAHVRMNVGGVRMKLIIKASIANAIWFLKYGRIPRQEGKMVPTAAQVVESWAEPLLNEVGSSS